MHNAFQDDGGTRWFLFLGHAYPPELKGVPSSSRRLQLAHTLVHSTQYLLIPRIRRLERGPQRDGHVVHAVDRTAGIDAVRRCREGHRSGACCSRLLWVERNVRDTGEVFAGGVAEVAHRVAGDDEGGV